MGELPVRSSYCLTILFSRKRAALRLTFVLATTNLFGRAIAPYDKWCQALGLVGGALPHRFFHGEFEMFE
jgi:hypothetical protein